MEKWIFFLRKIKLITDFNVEIPLSTPSLIEKINDLLHQDKNTFLSGSYSSKSQFIGKVNKKGFKVRNNLMQMTGGKTVVTAHGSFTDLKEKTKINIEIKGFDTFMHFFYGIQLLLYSMFILYLLLNIDKVINQPFSLDEHLPFWKTVMNVIISAFVFFIITIYPYFKMRESMKELEDDLVRELHSLSKE